MSGVSGRLQPHLSATPRDLQGPRGYQCSQFQPVPHWEHPSCSPFASEQALLCPRALQRHATVPAAREDAEGGDEESHPLLRPSPSSQALPRGRACSSSAAPLAASCLSQISSGCPPAAPHHIVPTVAMPQPALAGLGRCFGIPLVARGGTPSPSPREDGFLLTKAMASE